MNNDILSNSFTDRRCPRLLRIIAFSAIPLICSCSKKPTKVYFRGEASFSTEPANKTISIALPEILNDGQGDSEELVAVLVARSSEKTETRVLMVPLSKLKSFYRSYPRTITAEVEKFPDFEKPQDLFIRLSEGPNSKSGPNFKDARHLGHYIFHEHEWLRWWERIHLWKWTLGTGSIILGYFILTRLASPSREIQSPAERNTPLQKQPHAYAGVSEVLDYRYRAIEAIHSGNIPLAEALLARDESLPDSHQPTSDLLSLILEHGISIGQIKVIMDSPWSRSVVFRDYGRGNLLHESIRNGKTEDAYTIITHTRQTEDLLLPDSQGTTPFHLAAQSGNQELLDLLLIYDRQSVSLEALDAENNSPFHYAACAPSTLKYLCAISDNNPKLIFRPNKYGDTPLCTNARSSNRGADQAECWRFLLGIASDEEIYSEKKGSLLHVVAAVGTRKMMGDLLLRTNNVSDLASTDTQGQTAAQIALNSNRPFFAAMIEEKALYFTKKKKAAQVIIPPYTKEPIEFDAESYQPLSLELRLTTAIDQGDVEQFKKFFDEDQDLALNYKTPLGSPLSIVAANKGQPEILEFLLDNGFSVNLRNDNLDTALHHAASSNCVECAQILIARSANINAQDVAGATALIVTATYGRTEVAEILLRSYADTEILTHKNETALMWAASNGFYDCIELLLLHGSGLLNSDALSYAAHRGHSDCAGLLIMAGAEPDYYQENNWAPLNCAIAGGEYIEVCIKLLMHGADPSLFDTSGRPPIFHAIDKRNVEIVKLLMDHGAVLTSEYNNQTPLMHACEQGEVPIIQLLLNGGADPNYSIASCNSLDIAAKGRDLDVFKILVSDPRSDLNRVDCAGQTILMRLAKWGNTDAIEVLLQESCSVAILDSGSHNALHLAAINDHAEVIKLFHRYGADIESRGVFNYTALHFAVIYGAPNALEALIELNANIEAREDNQATVLILASEVGALECAKILVAAGADLAAVDKNSRTAMEVANKRYHPAVAKYLHSISKHLIGCNTNKNILLHICTAIPRFNKPEDPVEVFIDIFSAFAIASQVTKPIGDSTPKVWIEEALTSAEPLSTNLPYFDQKILGLLLSLIRAYCSEFGQQREHWGRVFTDIKEGRLFPSNSVSFVTINQYLARGNAPTLNYAGDSIVPELTREEQASILSLLSELQIAAASADVIAGYTYDGAFDRVMMSVKEANGEEIVKDEGRYGYPLKHVDLCVALIANAASVATLEDAGKGKQSAFLYAAKKNRPDLMLAMSIGRYIRNGSFNHTVSQRNLDEALFWGVSHGNHATVKLCLEFGAKIDAAGVLANISSAELAIHLDYRQVVEAFAAHAGKSYTEFSQQEIPNIKARYAALGNQTAAICYKSDTSLQFGYAVMLAERFLDGKYIRFQLRRLLNIKDGIQLSSINSSHDLYKRDTDLVEMPEDVINRLRAEGINLDFPNFDPSLVTKQDVEQIYQELLVGNRLGQAPTLSLERFGSGNEQTAVELGEVYKNTLVGQTLIFTDQVQKQFWSDTSYLSPQLLDAYGPNLNTLLSKEKSSDYNHHITENSLPEDLDREEYIERVAENFAFAGGVQTPAMRDFSLGYLKVRCQYMKERGFVSYITGGGRWKNKWESMKVGGNTIYCSQTYALYEDQTYTDANGNEIKFRDDSDQPTARYITENVAKVPEFARFFELLKVVYSLQPIAELAVVYEATPDFAAFQIPFFTPTPEYIADFYHRSLTPAQELADLSIEELCGRLDAAGAGAVSLCGGTAYTNKAYEKPERYDPPQPKIVCPVFASKDQAFAKPSYNSDRLQSKLYEPGTLFRALRPDSPNAGAPKFFIREEDYQKMVREERATAAKMYDAAQIYRNPDYPSLKDSMEQYVLTVRAWLPTGPAAANPIHGVGGVNQIFAENINPDAAKNEELLRSAGVRDKLNQ